MNVKPLHRARSIQSRSRIVEGEFKSDSQPDLYAGILPLEALKAMISIAVNHKDTFSVMCIDVSRAYFYANAQRLVLVLSPVEDRMGVDFCQERNQVSGMTHGDDFVLTGPTERLT